MFLILSRGCICFVLILAHMVCEIAFYVNEAIEKQETF
ncbi:hypothetical protein C1A50_3737 [Paenibacillus polymyxa]|nr:hypothetical protein C1A50_3737 [Paenibacillus polymyxa]